jgi:hypothetical protein
VLTPLVHMTLSRLAAETLADINPRDVSRALRTVRRAAARASWGPSLIGLSAALATGAAVGVLLAPRAGKETRSALRDRLRQALRSMRSVTGPETDSPSGPRAAASAPDNGHAARV